MDQETTERFERIEKTLEAVARQQQATTLQISATAAQQSVNAFDIAELKGIVGKLADMVHELRVSGQEQQDKLNAVINMMMGDKGGTNPAV